MERDDSSLPLYPIEQWQNTSQSSPASLAPPSPPTTTSSCHIDESYKYIFLPLCYSVTFLLSLVLNSIILHRSFCGGRGQQLINIRLSVMAVTRRDGSVGVRASLLSE
ncbi:UNVERIFIED_CONTAM: hypothetical protein FKN15_012443 [Acipenser sinensis]